ncbi:tol-pal system YbgF family protein [Streptomyces litchfieldiae]|uniref:Transcriptional regulator n=1 Tax=Streptomyces litchfieldiae TaxID=3075543 RepID=A0ABU2MT29_9ACTN|nr:transcriptional regulator [Streptomyces sp. DSM 44938]MDT0344793.1 transcriptional regulator [Streptomyces sp. DSM 44938]
MEELIELGRIDMDPSRRGALSAGLFSVALTVPGWPDVVSRMEFAVSGHARRIGRADVEVVEAMTGRLSELDDQFGGRHARPMTASFLVNTVGPLLRADASTEVRNAVYSAAAFLSYLTGWMAVDEGLHGLAQRYYVKGLQLAGAAGDHRTYCHILRGMSVQAVDLGHGSTALRLANASASAAPNTGPRLRAFMSGQVAHSCAVAGDRAAALRSLRETEVAVDQAESSTRTFGGYGPSTLAYHTAQVRYALGDIAGSVSSLHLASRLRDPTRRRTRVRLDSFLAERQLELGQLEAACATWDRVLDDYPFVDSARADDRIATMRALLRPHSSAPCAKELLERTRGILATRAKKP